MYFPYLRAKQFELLAIREFAQEDSEKRIFPILEPVKKTFNSLNKALDIFVNYNLNFSIILNPKVGDIFNDATLGGHLMSNYILDNLSESIKDSENFHPAFIVLNNTSYRALSDYINEKGLDNILLIINSIGNPDDVDFQELCNDERVKFLVFETINRSLKRRLLNSGKNIVNLKDSFNTQKRNVDYENISDELFSEEHAFFADDSFYGFSDYTTIGRDYIEGGRLPYAVAIHLTYKKTQEQIWIKHFVSDTNDDNSNIQGKFGEAAEKAVEFIDRENMHYLACEELRKYYHEQSYPGLGVIKKISIKNHLELVNDILINQ